MYLCIGSTWPCSYNSSMWVCYVMTVQHWLDRAHPAISHCSHLQKKMYSGYKCKSMAKSAVLVIQKLYMLGVLNTIRVSNSLDPDQVRHFVGPDLGLTCLQRQSEDNKSRP